MKKYFLFFLLLPFMTIPVHAIGVGERIIPPGTIVSDPESWSLVRILSYGEEFLLKAVLPLVVVGVSLYVAYELLTAEGDEAKLKKAWKTISYSAIGLVVIALAYTLISLISSISF